MTTFALPPSPFPQNRPMRSGVSWLITCVVMAGISLFAVVTNRTPLVLTGLVVVYALWAAIRVLAQLYLIEQEIGRCKDDYNALIKHGLTAFLTQKSKNPSLLRRFLCTREAIRLGKRVAGTEALLNAYQVDLDAILDQSRQAGARLPAAGLLGTVIGLSLMLFGFEAALNAEGAAVTQNLQASLAGMGAAFYTTLAGAAGQFLVSGLASVAERAGDRLIIQVAAVASLLDS